MSQTFSRGKLKDDYEDALFRLIMTDYARAEGEVFLRENGELSKNLESHVTPAELRKFQRMMYWVFRKRAAKAALKNVYNTLNKAAIYFVLASVLAVGLTMSVQAIRINVLNFLVSFEEEYASIQIGEGNGSGIIGENLHVTWRDAYVPTYIPDGFKITKLTNEQEFKAINYMHEDGRTLFYYVLAPTFESNVDTENAQRVESTVIQGYEALFVEKHERCTIAWVMNGLIFQISGNVSEEELHQIAEGVIFIE